MAIELPPWLTRQYDYASGIRQTGQVIVNNLQRNKQLETAAIHAAAQAEQARALEGWRIAQTQALQQKAFQEQEAQAENRARISAFLKATSQGEDRQTAADKYLLGSPAYDQVRHSQEAFKPSTPTAFDQREGAFQRLNKILDERSAEEKRQQAAIKSRENPIRSLKESPETVEIPAESFLQEDFLREQAGIPKSKAKVEGKLDDKTKQEIVILRAEKTKLEKKPNLTEEEKDALITINTRLAEVTGVPGLVSPIPEVEVKVEELQMPSNKKPYKIRPAQPGRAQ